LYVSVVHGAKRCIRQHIPTMSRSIATLPAESLGNSRALSDVISHVCTPRGWNSLNSRSEEGFDPCHLLRSNCEMPSSRLMLRANELSTRSTSNCRAPRCRACRTVTWTRTRAISPQHHSRRIDVLPTRSIYKRARKRQRHRSGPDCSNLPICRTVRIYRLPKTVLTQGADEALTTLSTATK
jgi:hypothetical protein